MKATKPELKDIQLQKGTSNGMELASIMNSNSDVISCGTLICPVEHERK